MRRLGFAILILICLAVVGCTHQEGASQPTSTPIIAQPFDGEWLGQGVLTGGSLPQNLTQPITLTITVAAGRITGLSYAYPGLVVPCKRIDHLAIPPASQPAIEDGNFAAQPGSDLSIQGVFNTGGSAAGEMSVNWQGRPTCSAVFSAAWQAKRQLVSVTNTPAPARTAGFCGVGVDCRALFGQLLILGLSNGAVLALIATGITLIYSTVRILNLAHGDVFALTTALVTTLVNSLALQPAWNSFHLALALGGVCLAAVGFGALLSLLVEQAAFQPFRGVPGASAQTAPLIASLGISFILFQAALVWRTFQHSWIPGEHRSVPGLPEVPTDRIPDLLPTYDILPRLGLHLPFALRLNDLLVILVALVFAIGVSSYLRRTRIGRSLRAFSQNPQLAQIVGVDSRKAMRQAFALGGGLAGAAAFIFALYYARPFGDAGAQSGLLAFAAALLGGVGSPIGALLSGLSMGIFSAFSDYFLPAAWTPILQLALLIILLALYPGGLGGGKEETDAAPSSPAETAKDANTERSATFAHRLQGILRSNPMRTAAGLLLLGYPLLTQFTALGGQMILSGIGIFAILALGLYLPLGLAGVLDLGAAASFAVGAYAAAWLSSRLPAADFGLVLAFGAGLGALAGLIKGLLARRLHNNSLAAATLALGLMVQKLIILARPLTGGSGGIGAIPPPRLLGLALAAPNARYYLTLLLTAATVFICQRLAISRPGRAWQAVREDEQASRANGIDAGAARQAVMLLSGLLAGAAGALQAVILGYVDPGAAAFHVSVMALAIVILGGSGNSLGVVAGAALIIGYDKVIIPQLATLLAYFWPKGVNIGPVPDLRGASFFNFGIALYLTVLLRHARRVLTFKSDRSKE